jgi:hypothetical protein
MKINDASNGASEKEPPTSEEIRLGTRTHVVVRRITLACTIVLLAIVVFVATQVPLNTTVAYNRLGSEFRLPALALLVPPGLLFSIWIRGRDPKKMEKLTRENATCWSSSVLYS